MMMVKLVRDDQKVYRLSKDGLCGGFDETGAIVRMSQDVARRWIALWPSKERARVRLVFADQQ